jgi:hypothetical protein
VIGSPEPAADHRTLAHGQMPPAVGSCSAPRSPSGRSASSASHVRLPTFAATEGASLFADWRSPGATVRAGVTVGLVDGEEVRALARRIQRFLERDTRWRVGEPDGESRISSVPRRAKQLRSATNNAAGQRCCRRETHYNRRGSNRRSAPSPRRWLLAWRRRRSASMRRLLMRCVVDDADLSSRAGDRAVAIASGVATIAPQSRAAY